MIVREFYKTRADGINLYRTYSDEGYKIRQIETGVIYDEAIDVEISHYTYEETNIPIEAEDANIEENASYAEQDASMQLEDEYLEET